MEGLEDRPLLDSELIVFAAAIQIGFDGIRRGGITVMRPDGTWVRQLTTFSTINYNFEPHGLNLPDDHPSFSPDGRNLVDPSPALARPGDGPIEARRRPGDRGLGSLR
jgi:hypothetical protein